MGYESRTELVARLVKVDAAIDKIREAQSYNMGSMGRTGALYRDLMQERKDIIAEINEIDAADTGGIWNKAKFVKP